MQLPISWVMWEKWIQIFCAVQIIITSWETMWAEAAWNNTMKNNSWASGVLNTGSRIIRTGWSAGMQTVKSDTPAIAGRNLHTYLDIELQQLAEKLLSYKVGSIVAIEPKTGGILAMASEPRL